MAEQDSLVSRRPKRSTAGNRMELALAELALEVEPQEVEEDIDFIVDKEEEDIFESDFASTDEEAAREDVDEGDKSVREEERRERKSARARLEKATAAAHARQRVTFNPAEASSSQPKSKLPSKSKRRVSLGVVVNAETGEVIDGGTGTVGVKRQSQRRHTIMNTSATVNRIKDAEEKRAAIPKKTKTITRLPTQDELIARALDTEEGNINEHRNYLRLEEEKRAKARVVKPAIEGPVLRWISKKETIDVEVQIPPPPPAPPTTAPTNLYGAKYSFVYTSGAVPGTVGTQAYSMPFYAYTPFVAQSAISKPQATPTTASTSVPTTVSASSQNPPTYTASSTATTSLATNAAPSPPSTSSSHPVPPASSATDTVSSTAPQQLQQPSQPSAPTQSVVPPSSVVPLQASYPGPSVYSYPLAPVPPIVVHRTEQVCKNYVVHELSQSFPSKPAWVDTMSAMFGDHVRWDEVKVFTGKGRPLSRPVPACSITGQPAKYCDPRTNVPFANLAAYDILTKVLGRGYVWSSALGCYVGPSEIGWRAKGASGATSGADASGSSKAGEEHAEEDGDGDVEMEIVGQEEPNVKRRKVG